MAYGPRASELRRCIVPRSDGTPCRAWAVWGSATQACSSHGGRAPPGQGGHRERGRFVPCECAAYPHPHRPSAGLCRWPDPPLKRHEPPPQGERERDKKAERLRGIAKRMRRAARKPAPIPPRVPFHVAWAAAQDDHEPEVHGEAEVMARARWRYHRRRTSDQPSLAWAAVPRAEREAMLARLAAGHWGGLRRVSGSEAEWVLYYGRWKVRGLWDRARERLVVLAVIGVC